MILKTFVLATLAITSTASENGSNTLLRGKNQKDSNVDGTLPQERKLNDIMNLGVGQMVCEEREPYDGTVVCALRMKTPKDLTTASVMHDCIMRSSRDGSNFCLGSQVYRVPFNDVPEEAQLPPPPPVNNPPPLVVPAPVPAPLPAPVPAPVPATSLYSQFQCRPLTAGRCKGTHPVQSLCNRVPSCCPGNIIEDWRTGENTCKHGAGSQMVTKPVANNPVANNPVANNPSTGVDANVNQLPSSPINQGKIEAFFTNKEFCPDTMPEDFTHSCVGHWGGRCGYMLTGSNGLQTRMTCDCNWDCVLQCRVYNGP